MTGLADIPARMAAVELQMVQLRDEMRAGFSAARAEQDLRLLRGGR